MSVPDGILCTKSHEYILEEEGNPYKIGITEYAAEQLGDIVFVELPEVDTEFQKGEIFGTIESVKAASELYMPVSGKIVEINEELINKPELINSDTYEKGWLIKVELEDKGELDEAMEYDDYIAEVG